MKIQPTELEKIFSNICKIGFNFQNIQTALQLNAKKTPKNLIRKCAEDLNKCFSKEKFRWPTGTWKHAQFSSVQFSDSVVSDSLRTHESQHARPPCPSPSPGVHSDSRPSSPWCHPAISSSVVPFSSCPQSLPASESFSMSQLFAWDGQSTGVSASASFLAKKSQGWSSSEWTGWISLQESPRDSQESSPTPQFKSINSSALSLLHSPTITSIHDHRKNHSLDSTDLSRQK